MENIAKIYLKYTYTDGDTEIKVVNLIGDEIVSSQYTTAKIKTVEGNAFKETSIELSAIESKPLKWFDVEFSLSDKIATPQLFMFYNATITNDWVNTIPFDKTKETITRDVLTLKNKENDATFGIGFVTANRFWAYMKSRPNSITLRYSMEDKPLKLGETYNMERFIFAENMLTETFLEGYAARIAEIYNIKLNKPIYSGWCSWSCYYTDINQKGITNVAQQMEKYFDYKKPGLIQLDDGWQVDRFPGKWVEDREKFPDGIKKIAELANEKGMDFGLWLAPFLASEKSRFYDEMKWATLKNSRKVHLDWDTLDLGKPEVLQHIKNTFKMCCDDLKSVYFKLDFLILSLRREGAIEDFVHYEEDYSVAVYRKALMAVRETIGEERFLLLCGAPILEAAGIFDGSRIGSDIAWGRNKTNPDYWLIIKHCIANTMLRYFYHNKVYINDPDGVILRDVDNGDSFDPTYAEVRAWATATAMSGGLILENDEIEKLSDGRRKLFEDILPVYGKAAKPLDFYEQPFPSIAYIDTDSETKLVSAYNYEDKIVDITLPLEKLGFDGYTIVVKCWEREVPGIFEKEYTEVNATRHNGFIYLLKKCGNKPCAVYVDCNVYGGVDIIEQSFEGDVLKVKASQKLEMCKERNLYVYAPTGHTCQGEVVFENEKGKVAKTCVLIPGETIEIKFTK